MRQARGCAPAPWPSGRMRLRVFAGKVGFGHGQGRPGTLPSATPSTQAVERDDTSCVVSSKGAASTASPSVPASELSLTKSAVLPRSIGGTEDGRSSFLNPSVRCGRPKPPVPGLSSTLLVSSRLERPDGSGVRSGDSSRERRERSAAFAAAIFSPAPALAYRLLLSLASAPSDRSCSIIAARARRSSSARIVALGC